MVLYTILAKGTRWDKEEYLESETLVEEAMECEQIQSLRFNFKSIKKLF